MERLEEETEPYEDSDLDLEGAVSLKTVTARERYQGGSFKVLARKQAIARYPCHSCHREQQSGQPVARDAALLTHGNVELHHGQPGALSCIDCHSEKDRDVLADREGNSIDFDHSYELCGQCHFRQKSDWLGGAHGKRVDYWAGERVIYNCTSCHDPHSPRFEKRFPATYSPEMEQRRQQAPQPR